MTFADATTAVAVSGSNTPDAVRSVLRSGSPLRGSPAFVELLGHVQVKSALWFAANGTSPIFDDLASFGIRPESIVGSIDLDRGASARARLRLDTADQASQLARMLEGELSTVRAFVSKLEIVADGADIRIEVVLDEARANALAALLERTL